MAFTITIYTIAEAAEELDIGKETLRNWIELAALNHHKVGNIELITGEELEILRKMDKPKVGRRLKRKGA